MIPTNAVTSLAIMFVSVDSAPDHRTGVSRQRLRVIGARYSSGERQRCRLDCRRAGTRSRSPSISVPAIGDAELGLEFFRARAGA